MSFDLMVYDRKKAPETKEEFMKWFRQQIKWEEDHDYADIEVTTPELKGWFLEMIKNFPPVKGKLAPSEEEIEKDEELKMHLTDYSVGRDMIYASFGWSVSKQAGDVAKKLAMVYGVGFFNPN